ncbi:MAG TPA: saccharopine dehydrogenase family protein [Candidatus Aminicenantes bacterium]|nr:saccharopine dehydrogenase family protein [Candidatus Aminicenantes bacterium]
MKKKRIIVLGSGLVGAPMALDLARDARFEVTVADISGDSLAKCAADRSIRTIQADLSDAARVQELVAGQDLALNAVPGFLGYQTLKAVITAGKDVVDIAFFAEDPFLLDELAKRQGVTAIVDCGVAPGMSNLLVGHVRHLLDKTQSALIYVGGLPELRVWPYEYKAVFSPLDVIEEYIRPARYVENGKLVVRPALSDPEYLNLPGVSSLVAFNSDGLRTLVRTLDIPNMKEKTLRYPGHIEKIAVLRETGFFGQEPVEIHGMRVRPIDLTARLLFPIWKLQPGETDITVMQVVVEGEKDGRRVRHAYDLFDRFDAASGVHSMARTTGYTATAAVRLLAGGLYGRKGIIPPEFVGEEPACVEFMLKELADRGVVYKHKIENI